QRLRRPRLRRLLLRLAVVPRLRRLLRRPLRLRTGRAGLLRWPRLLRQPVRRLGLAVVWRLFVLVRRARLLRPGLLLPPALSPAAPSAHRQPAAPRPSPARAHPPADPGGDRADSRPPAQPAG